MPNNPYRGRFIDSSPGKVGHLHVCSAATRYLRKDIESLGVAGNIPDIGSRELTFSKIYEYTLPVLQSFTIALAGKTYIEGKVGMPLKTFW